MSREIPKTTGGWEYRPVKNCSARHRRNWTIFHFWRWKNRSIVTAMILGQRSALNRQTGQRVERRSYLMPIKEPIPRWPTDDPSHRTSRINALFFKLCFPVTRWEFIDQCWIDIPTYYVMAAEMELNKPKCGNSEALTSSELGGDGCSNSNHFDQKQT